MTRSWQPPHLRLNATVESKHIHYRATDTELRNRSGRQCARFLWRNLSRIWQPPQLLLCARVDAHTPFNSQAFRGHADDAARNAREIELPHQAQQNNTKVGKTTSRHSRHNNMRLSTLRRPSEGTPMPPPEMRARWELPHLQRPRQHIMHRHF